MKLSGVTPLAREVLKTEKGHKVISFEIKCNKNFNLGERVKLGWYHTYAYVFRKTRTHFEILHIFIYQALKKEYYHDSLNKSIKSKLKNSHQ